MNQLNSIILEGNVVRQVEFSEPANGFKVCKFSIGVNRFSKNPTSGESFEEVSYFDIESYGKVAEVCEKQVEKGRGVRVVGRLKQNRWQDDSGKSCSRVIVVAEHVEYKPRLHKQDEAHDKTATSKQKYNSSSVENKNEESLVDEQKVLEPAEAVF